MTPTCYRCQQPVTPRGACACRDGICLVHGDCRDVLPWLEKGCVDLVLTDPPYGVNHKPKARRGVEATWQGNKIVGDESTELRDCTLDGFKNVAAFGGWKAPALPRAHTAVVWDKGPACGGMNFHAPWRMNWELIFIRGDAFKGGMDLGILEGHWIPTWQTRGKFHQHQKPLSLLKYFLARAPGVKFVLDPFAGSGTTGVAAKLLGRRCLMVEIEEKYVAIAANRLRQEVLGL